MSLQAWPPRPPRTPTVTAIAVQNPANPYISNTISTAGFAVALNTSTPGRVDWVAIQH